MATKVFTGSDLVFFSAQSSQAQMSTVAAAWPAFMNGDTGTVTCTSSYVSGSQLFSVIGSLFDDGSVPPVITITGVQLEWDWAITNGAKAGGVTASRITDEVANDTQAEGAFAGHFSDTPAVLDIFPGDTRADLFTVPSIVWSYYGTFTGAFSSHDRRVAVTNYTATITYTTPVTPVVTSVVPSSGSVSGGQQVTIFGEGFTGATQVEFGGSPATSVVVVDDTHITAVTPAHLSGTVDVEVLTVATGTGLYTYVLDTIKLPPMPVRTPMTQGGGKRGR